MWLATLRELILIIFGSFDGNEVARFVWGLIELKDCSPVDGSILLDFCLRNMHLIPLIRINGLINARPLICQEQIKTQFEKIFRKIWLESNHFTENVIVTQQNIISSWLLCLMYVLRQQFRWSWCYGNTEVSMLWQYWSINVMEILKYQC